jgi:mannose-6-phosphate isomerase-like protein (cupin superfamily)
MIITLWILAGLCLYIGIGQFLIRVIFREQLPSIPEYFQPGDVLHSNYEGFTITINRQEKGLVYGSLSIGPRAAGPPVHRHLGFDESFSIENGQVSLIHGEKKQTLTPGEEVLIRKGEAHKFFNETDETIRAKGEFVFPEKFAFTLCQLYGFMDEYPDFEKSPKVMLQIPLFQQNGFDSYIAGPPIAVQKLMGLLISPIARLLGYRSYYPKYQPIRK